MNSLTYFKRLGSGVLLLLVIAACAPRTTATPVISTGIGIMGDSNSDEYRADNARGGDYGPTTLNWVEQLVKNRSLNFGSWGTWGEPRRTGYEYNWARSGATAMSLIESGQHTGLAQQVASGRVSVVVLWIGSNDFHLTNGTYEEIYNGSLSDEALQDKINLLLENIRIALDTVMNAGDVKMIIVDIGDQSIDPAAAKMYPDPVRLQRVSNAIKQANTGIQELAAERGISLIKSDDFARVFMARLDAQGFLQVGDAKIDFKTRGNDPYHVQLDDSSGHAGTVLSGLFANIILIEPLKENYGIDIPPLTEDEILSNAGIK